MGNHQHISRKAYYQVVRVALRAAELTFGRSNARVGSIARYMGGLIDSGRHAEFDALIGHAFSKVKAIDRTRRFLILPRRRTGLTIDARTEVLRTDGTLADKTTAEFPSDTTPIVASVIIPCFNYGRYLLEAVESATQQTLSPIEVIIVDDGSTDPLTTKVVGTLEQRGDVRVIRKDNGGLPMARNTGIEAACGEYICCLDADDILAPTYLETMVAMLELDRSAGFAYSWVAFFGDVSEVWQTKDFQPQDALRGNFTSVAAVFRRDDWQAAGGYSPEMKGGFEDWEFWIRLVCLGRRGIVARWPLFLHRRHGRTMTHDAKDMGEELRQRMIALNPAFYENRTFRRALATLSHKPGKAQDMIAKLKNCQDQSSSAEQRLLIVVRWLKQGGAEMLLLSLIKALQQDGWSITLVTTSSDTHAMHDAFASFVSEIFHLDAAFDDTGKDAMLGHLLSSRSPDIVLTSGCAWFTNRVATLRHLSKVPPVVAIIHNEVPAGPFRSLVRHQKEIDRIVTVSSLAKQALTDSGVPSDKVEHIANGVNIALDATVDLDERPVHAGTVLKLLWIGRLSAEKRPLAFVDLVSRLSSRCKTHATMIGDGPLLADVEAAIRRTGSGGIIKRHTHVDHGQLGRFYLEADFLVLTSTTEGMPLVVLEALAHGCWIAASLVGDIGKAVKHQENGLLVDPSELFQLERLLLNALRNDFKCLKRRHEVAAAFAQSKFTSDAMIDSYRSLLERVRTAQYRYGSVTD